MEKDTVFLALYNLVDNKALALQDFMKILKVDEKQARIVLGILLQQNLIFDFTLQDSTNTLVYMPTLSGVQWIKAYKI